MRIFKNSKTKPKNKTFRFSRFWNVQEVHRLSCSIVVNNNFYPYLEKLSGDFGQKVQLCQSKSYWGTFW
jgi:hypothetical protein